jgi:hypothetical protein
MKLNEQDLAALREITDFVISDDGMSAVADGAEVVISRAADDSLRLLVKFPTGKDLDVQLSRGRLLQELNIKADDS